MTTAVELKENLIKQYNDTVAVLQKIEGAISACNELIEPTQEEEETDA